MVRKSYLLMLAILIALPALAQDPYRFKAVPELAYRNTQGKDRLMPQVLLEHFKIPVDHVNALVREVMIPNDGLCCRWVVKIIEIPNLNHGPRKRLLMVSDYQGPIFAEHGGKIRATEGENIWLLNEKGELLGTCHWIEGSAPEELDPNISASLAQITWDLKDWVAKGGDPFRK